MVSAFNPSIEVVVLRSFVFRFLEKKAFSEEAKIFSVASEISVI